MINSNDTIGSSVIDFPKVNGNYVFYKMWGMWDPGDGQFISSN